MSTGTGETRPDGRHADERHPDERRADDRYPDGGDGRAPEMRTTQMPPEGRPGDGPPPQGPPPPGPPQQGRPPQQGQPPQQGHPQQGQAPQQGQPAQQGHPQQGHPDQGRPPQGQPQGRSPEPAGGPEPGRYTRQHGDQPGQHDHDSRERSISVLDPTASDRLRGRWTEVQAGFVDSPRQAVAEADQLVGEVLDEVSRVFRDQRSELEAEWGGNNEPGTEELRQALQRYREFFDRLLSL